VREDLDLSRASGGRTSATGDVQVPRLDRQKHPSYGPCVRRLLLLGVVMIALGASATAETSITIAARNSGFEPAEVRAPRDARVRIDVVNETDRKVEFESFKLNREHVIKPGGHAIFYLQGLSAGRYEFFDELNREHVGVLLVE
jgi:hypothetical protein